MSEQVTDLNQRLYDHAYWLGWFTSLVTNALRDLEQRGPDGEYIVSREDAIRNLRLGWDGYAQTPDGLRNGWLDERIFAGFVVEDAQGVPQSFRRTYGEAQDALRRTEAYWDEAAACGHPNAPGYVANLRPFTIRQITKAEHAEIMEDGVPIIDREP